MMVVSLSSGSGRPAPTSTRPPTRSATSRRARTPCRPASSRAYARSCSTCRARGQAVGAHSAAQAGEWARARLRGAHHERQRAAPAQHLPRLRQQLAHVALQVVHLAQRRPERGPAKAGGGARGAAGRRAGGRLGLQRRDRLVPRRRRGRRARRRQAQAAQRAAAQAGVQHLRRAAGTVGRAPGASKRGRGRGASACAAAARLGAGHALQRRAGPDRVAGHARELERGRVVVGRVARRPGQQGHVAHGLLQAPVPPLARHLLRARTRAAPQPSGVAACTRRHGEQAALERAPGRAPRRAAAQGGTSSVCRRRCTSSTTDTGPTSLSEVSQKVLRSTIAGLAVSIQRSSSASRLAAKSSMTTSAWLSRLCRPPAQAAGLQAPRRGRPDQTGPGGGRGGAGAARRPARAGTRAGASCPPCPPPPARRWAGTRSSAA